MSSRANGLPASRAKRAGTAPSLGLAGILLVACAPAVGSSFGRASLTSAQAGDVDSAADVDGGAEAGAATGTDAGTAAALSADGDGGDLDASAPADPTATGSPRSPYLRSTMTEEAKRRDDAILLSTLIGKPSNVGYSLGSLVGGLGYVATGVPYAGGAALYVARGGSLVPALAPGILGLTSMVVGGYYFASGRSLLELQIELALAWNRQVSYDAILDTFEPRLRQEADWAKRRRKTFAYGLLGLSAVTLAAGIYTAYQPVTNLEGAALPALLCGVALIDAVGAFTFLTYESPPEIAWDAYVRNSTWR